MLYREYVKSSAFAQLTRAEKTFVKQNWFAESARRKKELREVMARAARKASATAQMVKTPPIQCSPAVPPTHE